MSKQHKKLAQVRVVSPCTAEWDEMRGNDQVRFCEHCAKHVHNLSTMTPRRAQKLVELSGGNLCVRYYARPDGAPKVTQQRLYPLQRRALRLAAGAFTAVLSVAANLPAPLMAATSSPSSHATHALLPQPQTHAAGGYGRLAGAIKTDDEEKPEPIPRALVRLINRETTERYETTTNDAGEFTLEDLPAGDYRMLVKAKGFEKQRTKSVTIASGEAKRLDVPLRRRIIFAGGMGFSLEVATPNELLEAVNANDVAKARQLLDSGQFALNQREPENPTAGLLGIAVRRGSYEMTKLLLEAGAKVGLADEDGETPFMQLGDTATPELVNLLLKHGANIKQRDDEGRSIFHYVTYKATPEIIDTLIKAGAEVNVQDDEGETPLMLAAGDSATETVKLLLDAGANLRAVDDDGSLAWHYLSAEAPPELIKLFLDAGIDIEQRDHAGATLLLLLSGQETKTLATLIKHGANINTANNEGLTPLMVAAMSNQTENIKLLLKSGAIVNARDNDGMTPLILAAQSQDTDTVRLLLKAGAEVNASDNKGYTALSYALTNEDEDTIKLLRRKGGVGEKIPAPQEETAEDDAP